MAEFRFNQPKNLAVFVCDKVFRGQPILYVSRDDEGDWQFLCGGAHADQDIDDPKLICLEDVVEQDPSVNELSEMCAHDYARREHPGAPWQIHDGMEEIVRDNVSEHGCHVMQIEADDEGPAFAYSIGLSHNYEQPELICFGLDLQLMCGMINALRDRMADGEALQSGQRLSGLIEGFDCELRSVKKSEYAAYFGYALWYHEGDDFEALQIVWPDKQSRFPWDEGCVVKTSQQPVLYPSP